MLKNHILKKQYSPIEETVFGKIISKEVQL